MTLEELFELIRTEDVCLWIGAGFSKYAGYPTGGELKGLIEQSLTEQEKLKLSSFQNLRDFAEYFTVIKKGRKELESLLRGTFLQKPKSTYYHDLLSRIPHFRTIITTNYDQLIENSYSRKAFVISSEKDFIRYDSNLCGIYKIHGDINDGPSMVITTRDYSTMYNRLPNNPFWAKIRSELATKHIIFLGYGYEDENVWADFDGVYAYIGEHKLQRVMIGPGIDELKHERLIQNNISFIEMSGEKFVVELVEHLKKNIVFDMENQRVSLQTAVSFMTGFDMVVSTESYVKTTKLISMYKRNGLSESKIEFSTTDKDFIEKYNKLLSGKGDTTIEISNEKLLSFVHSVDGFHWNTLQNISKLGLMMVPSLSEICIIQFPGHDLEIRDVKLDVFVFNNKSLKIKCQIYGFDFELETIIKNSKKTNVKINITAPKDFSSVGAYKDAYHVFDLLLSDNEVRIYRPKIDKPLKHKIQMSKQIDEIRYFHQLYVALATIEKYFDVRFTDVQPNSVTTIDRGNINMLTSLINKGYYARDIPDGISFKLDREMARALDKGIPKDMVFILQAQPKYIELLGQRFDLGEEQIILSRPVDYQVVKRKKEFIVRDATNLVVFKYSRFGMENFSGLETVYDKKLL